MLLNVLYTSSVSISLQPQKSESKKTSQESRDTESTAPTSDVTPDHHPPPDPLSHPTSRADKQSGINSPENLDPPATSNESGPSLLSGDAAIKSEGSQPPVDAANTSGGVTGGSEERGNVEASGLNEDDKLHDGLFVAGGANRV